MPSAVRHHRWKFFRVGGFDQVRLDSADDLRALADLDQKLWVALSCPVQGLELDEKTLAVIDTDADGRIRAPEVIGAVKWSLSVLKSADPLLKGAASLPLSAIDGGTEEGARLLSSAKQILKNLDKEGAKEISVEDTADTARIFAQTKLNGDGVVPPASADGEDLQKAMQEVIDCVGSEADRSGAPGLSQALVDKFFTAAEAYSAWWRAAESDADNVVPRGADTDKAAAALAAVKGKIDDYFARTRLVAFDPRAAAPLNRDVAEYAALAVKELGLGAPEIASFPLSHVEAHRPLPLDTGWNPAWAVPMSDFVREVIAPLHGDKASLSDAEWAALKARLAPFEAWQAQKAGAEVEKLGLGRVRDLLEGGFKADIEALIQSDKALEPEANAIASVDKLVRYCRDLGTLLNNFVSFRDFYSRKKKGIFQAGTLYLDGRACELCIKVTDVAAHSTVATSSGTYLVYCDCTRKDAAEKLHIVAALTGGDADALMVGRNGVYYDRKGQDWDATVVKLIDHPISVRQAFWVPYRRVGKLIGDQIDKFAAARDKEMQDKAAAGVADAGKAADAAHAAAAKPAVPAAPAPPAPAAPAVAPAPPPFDIAKFTGIFAAIGLALAAIGSAVAGIFGSFLALKWWQMPLALSGVMLAISGPSMLIAWLKLRQRNIGPILDAAGWAVNARARLNIPFGASLTSVAKLPDGAEHSLDDPFEDKKTPWGRYAFIVLVFAGVLAAYKLGHVERWIDALKVRPPAAAPAPSGSASAAPPAAK